MCVALFVNKYFKTTMLKNTQNPSLKRIAQCDLCETGRSFRVDDINEESLDFGPSCGNFLGILSLIARHNPVVADIIRTGPMNQNAKYTHHTVHMLCWIS